MSDTLLDVRGLSIEFPTRHGVVTAVDRVSFSIGRGEILGLVGESGAGKSLTGLSLVGLLPPPGRAVADEIRFEGEAIGGLSEAQIRRYRGRRIGLIFQDPLTSLDPLFTIGDQLVETIRTHRPDLGRSAARRRAAELLAEVGIPEPEMRLAQHPHQFSGGMRQRVVIALAIAGDPALIVADEPTTALDVSVQAQITALLRRLARTRGTAVLLVTHDMGVIAETADRVAVMYAGRIVECGEADAVVRTPVHPYTAGLMGSIPKLGRRVERLQQIDGAMPRPGRLPPGCAFHPRCSRALPRCGVERPDPASDSAPAVACFNPLGDAAAGAIPAA